MSFPNGLYVDARIDSPTELEALEHLEAIGQHALDTGELLAFVADENPLPRWPDPLSVSELPTLPRLPED